MVSFPTLCPTLRPLIFVPLGIFPSAIKHTSLPPNWGCGGMDTLTIANIVFLWQHLILQLQSFLVPPLALKIYLYMLATFWCYFLLTSCYSKIAIQSSLLKVMETFHDKSSSATLNILGFLTIHCTSHFPLVLHVWFPWLFVLIPPKSISLVLVSFYTLINYGGSQRAFVYEGYICGYVPY